MWFSILLPLLALSVGSSYQLDGYSFGGGGVNGGSSPNFNYQGKSGQIGNQLVGESGYNFGGGMAYERQSPVTNSPNLSNDGNWVSRLHLKISPYSGIGNTTPLPQDTKYVVAISEDNFITTKYVSGNDYGLISNYTINDYKTFADWGGSIGFDILGLNPGKTYTVKVRTMQGKFTESEWSQTATSMTANPVLTYDIDVSAIDAHTDPPYVLDLSNMYPDSIVTSTNRVWVSLETNSANGGGVFLYGQNGGLKSLSVGYTISSVSGNLSSLADGFGIQAVGATATLGGPFLVESLYGGTGDVVGSLDTLVRQMFYTLSPITSGRASFVIKAKSSNNTPAASDYSEVLTVVAAANF